MKFEPSIRRSVFFKIWFLFPNCYGFSKHKLEEYQRMVYSARISANYGQSYYWFWAKVQLRRTIEQTREKIPKGTDLNWEFLWCTKSNFFSRTLIMLLVISYGIFLTRTKNWNSASNKLTDGKTNTISLINFNIQLFLWTIRISSLKRGITLNRTNWPLKNYFW